MLPMVRISFASLALLLPLADGALAQDARTDGVRLICLDRAGTWKDFNPSSPTIRTA